MKGTHSKRDDERQIKVLQTAEKAVCMAYTTLTINNN